MCYNNTTASSSTLNSVIIHCKETASDYLHELVAEYGVPVIDILVNQLSPFPKELQDLLDIYHWLLSGKSKQMLGFTPERIILCGKGFGGNLAVSLCCTINEMRNKLPESEREWLPFPSAV